MNHAILSFMFIDVNDCKCVFGCLHVLRACGKDVRLFFALFVFSFNKNSELENIDSCKLFEIEKHKSIAKYKIWESKQGSNVLRQSIAI